ncbi:nuclear transport factor 2 family protein [Sphingomonas sp. TX0543]|uniref:nuclear transport factor 2 family protein n=1 Tax=unclassified Sphingomonas TaxID=196159 RepID=UPI002015F2E6|nr:nuclear transport factor 2 family protein [Sphingomonas sp. 3P27F8]
MTENIQSFSSMLRQALGDRIDADATTFVEMMADDGVMEFPYAPAGLATRLEGRAAIAGHLEEAGKMIAFDRMGEPVVHPSTDPDIVVLEFEGFGRGVTTGEPYDQSYISVIRTSGGRIVHYRDYWNPLVALRATKGAALIDALVAGKADHA